MISEHSTVLHLSSVAQYVIGYGTSLICGT